MPERDHERRSIQLELEEGVEPIAGVLRSGGEEVAFRGWLELASLIEAARVATGDPPAPGEAGSGEPGGDA